MRWFSLTLNAGVAGRAISSKLTTELQFLDNSNENKIPERQNTLGRYVFRSR
jgi:hypothetical protein